VRRVVSEPKTEKLKDRSNDIEPESVRKGSDAPIIKDWVLDDEEEKVERRQSTGAFTRQRSYRQWLL
nr:hypothetical protein [Tanacetum cinerariifolium]